MKKLFKIFIVMFLVILSSCDNVAKADNPKEFLYVTLQESDEYEIASANPMQLTRGSDAKFKIDFDEGITFNDSEYGYFNEQTSEFIVPNVQSDLNVSFTTRPIGNCNLTIINDSQLGTYTITPNRTNFLVGETVTIKATPINENKFMCYTYFNPYRSLKYGSLTGMPLSFEEEYTFVIEKDITINLNYLSNDLLRMEYHANGGFTIDNRESILLDYQISAAHLNPVTLLGTYYLFKDGYTLESYNTEPDGSGTRVGIGSKVDISFANENKIKLYAQWVKWSDTEDFEFIEKDDGTYKLERYIGDADASCVVVPNEILNKKVSEISSYAFDNINVEKIILNLDLETLNSCAINECNELTSLLMFTNIVDAYNDSVNKSSLKTIYINSTTYTNNTTINERDISSQLDQIKAMKKDRVIFVGHTPLRYNHDITPFIKKYPNKDFYIFGTQEGANFAVPIDILSKFLNKKDKIIISIMETHINPKYIGYTTFTYLKYNLDLFSLLNYQDYINMFFPSYVQFMRYMEKGLTGKVCNAEQGNKLNEYGGLSYGKATTNIDNINSSYTPKLNNYQKEELYSFIPKIFNESEISNENIYITWSTYNKNSIKDYEMFNNFEKYIKSVLPNYVYYDSILENIYGGDKFIQNSSTILSAVGAEERINRWLEQLIL